jgi:Flp pilus assembly protein TadD
MEELKTLKEIKGYTDDELTTIAQIAYFMMMQGKDRESKILFEALVAIEPSNEYYYRGLGVIAGKQGDTDLAIRHFGYAIKLAPDQPHGYVNRAEIYISQGKKEEAEQDLQQALLHIKREDQALSQKAWALYRSLRFSEA